MASDISQWVVWAGRLSQLSLLPFLGFLWTLWRIPQAPRGAVQGFTAYLAFIAVAIPAGLYCRQVLGTSMANVDWVHGSCEALLTTANLLIVLGLRDALRQQPPGNSPNSSSSDTQALQDSDSSSTSSQNAVSSTISISNHPDAALDPTGGGKLQGVSAQSEANLCLSSEPPSSLLWTPQHPPSPSSRGPPAHSPAAAGPQGPPTPHTLPAPAPAHPQEIQPPSFSPTGRHSPAMHRRAPGIVRVQATASLQGRLVRGVAIAPAQPSINSSIVNSSSRGSRPGVMMVVLPRAYHQGAGARAMQGLSGSGVLLGRVR